MWAELCNYLAIYQIAYSFEWEGSIYYITYSGGLYDKDSNVIVEPINALRNPDDNIKKTIAVSYLRAYLRGIDQGISIGKNKIKEDLRNLLK